MLLVAYTAYDHDEACDRLAQAGFDGHLVKPASLDELISWLKRAAGYGEADLGRTPVTSGAG